MNLSLEEQVAAGKFLRYEHRAARRLWKLLPPEERHVIDADVRLFTLEAARRYDPSRGARFETFLFSHLLNRTRAHVLKAWAKRRRPEGGFVELTSHPNCCAAPIAEISELRDSVSDSTRSVLDLALEGNCPSLRDAFCSRYYQMRVGGLLGVSRKQVRDAVAELRIAIPKHISMGKE